MKYAYNIVTIIWKIPHDSFIDMQEAGLPTAPLYIPDVKLILSPGDLYENILDTEDFEVSLLLQMYISI